MSWVITSACEGERLAKCTVACPEDAIQTAPGAKQFYINPQQCTDCGLCDLTCPVAAIFPESAVPKQWKASIEENRLFFL
ncbi:4Fe-4S dicluster domain-containing protein [Paenibacillus sp. SYP-B4298]|uniref:4Fe-4S dicluster domain-containing protein n=1 Tax=Paenibacillus sp. SYP-B4298 TaxID=2996034 RepID=UPI0022DDB3E0|nr:4Fe-4S dicluster domain-containing protein [Paenibacillus sp. SYP-B4298]